jgi:hypothetical protein
LMQDPFPLSDYGDGEESERIIIFFICCILDMLKFSR